MIVEVFAHDDLLDYPFLKDLTIDFKHFKENSLLPDYFGRDADYRWPQVCLDEEVWHLHLSESVKPPFWKRWARSLYQKTSDKHLVYCRGYYNRSRYYLIAILEPDAHDQARNLDIMLAIGEMAAEFRANN